VTLDKGDDHVLNEMKIKHQIMKYHELITVAVTGTGAVLLVKSFCDASGYRQQRVILEYDVYP